MSTVTNVIKERTSKAGLQWNKACIKALALCRRYAGAVQALSRRRQDSIKAVL
jgi:hypothetical protein